MSRREDLHGTLRKAPGDLVLPLTSSELSQAGHPAPPPLLATNCSPNNRGGSPSSALLSNDQKRAWLALCRQHFQEAWVHV